MRRPNQAKSLARYLTKRRLTYLEVYTLAVVILTVVYLGVEASYPTSSSNAFVYFDWILLALLCIEFGLRAWR